MTQPEASPSNNADAGRGLSEGLGPLPEPDMLRGIDDDYYSAEAMNAERQRCYALGMAAERERCAKLVEDTQKQYPDDGLDGWLLAAEIRLAGLA